MQVRCPGCMRPKMERPVCEHCGYDERSGNQSHQLPVGTILREQYCVGRVLGQGGFGITYIGWDMNLDMPIAIKEYYPSGMVARENTQSIRVCSTVSDRHASFRRNRERFIQEARALAKLRNVPGVVHVLNFFTENDTAYIVMEYLEGINLRQYVRQCGGKIPAQEALTLLEPVMKALAKVHSVNMVHRDISPDNIMLLPDGTLKLLDFGAVREVEDRNTSREEVRSTEAILKHGFAPMEQYQKRGSLGPWTDEYALCATLYYMMTGEIPPDAPERLLEGVQLEWSKIPGLTPQQVAALEKGTAIMPAERIPSVEALWLQLYGEPIPDTQGEETFMQVEEHTCLEEERRKKEEQARLEEERRKKEEQARLEEERRKKEEQARLEEERRKKEEQACLEEEARRKKEEDRIRREEEVRRKKEEQLLRQKEAAGDGQNSRLVQKQGGDGSDTEGTTVRGNKKRWIVIVVIAVILAAAGMLLMPGKSDPIAVKTETTAPVMDEDQSAYEEATKLMAEGSYAEAAEKFKMLGDYSDSVHQYQQARFLLLKEYISDEQNELAYEIIQELRLSGYLNAEMDVLANQVAAGLYAMGQEAYRSGNYIEAAKFFEKTPHHAKTADYQMLTAIHRVIDGAKTADNYPDDPVGELVRMIGFEDASQLLLHNKEYAFEFLMGIWKTEKGSYFKLLQRNDGSYQISYSLPYNANLGSQYDRLEFVEGAFRWAKEGSSDYAYMYTMTVLSENEMEVYCHSNDTTHIVKRQGDRQ